MNRRAMRATAVAAAIGWTMAHSRRRLGARPRPGGELGAVRAEPGPAFRWRSGAEPAAAIKTAIRAAAADANDSRASKAPTFSYPLTAAA